MARSVVNRIVTGHRARCCGPGAQLRVIPYLSVSSISGPKRQVDAEIDIPRISKRAAHFVLLHPGAVFSTPQNRGSSDHYTRHTQEFEGNAR